MENQRIRLSKKLMKDALISILAEKPIEKITVSEICEKAQINRTTFYKYYGSQYELLKDIENDLFSELEMLFRSSDISEVDAIIKILNYLQKEKEKCCVLMNSIPFEIFTQKLFSLPALQNIISKNIVGKVPNREKKYISLFYCHGGYAIIRNWLDEGCRESPAEIAGILKKLSLMM